MHDNIRLAFENLINHPMFKQLVDEYRHRFGIPSEGFSDINSDQYKNWVKEGLRKSDFLRSEFVFLAKRCRNLIPDKNPVPSVILAYYFIFNKKPSATSLQNDYIFRTMPSGILGCFNLILTVPLLFTKELVLQIFQNSLEEINKLSIDSMMAIQKLSESQTSTNYFDSKSDLLATTPGNGGDAVDRVHRDIAYLVELGRIGLREHLSNMRESDFIVHSYNDKNKPIDGYTQMVGTWLLNRGLYSVSESYWTNIDSEIVDFNRSKGITINRGIPLANLGVSQLAQGKVIEGLFNLYKAYDDDKRCLAHLSGITINPENDMANSRLFTQFEGRLTSRLFHYVVTKYKFVFITQLSENDLSKFIQTLGSDKKLLLYITLYRYSFAESLNNELTTIISRSEVIRSLAELALWFEDELKRKDLTLTGKTLINILDQKVGQLNPTRGQYTNSTNLSELNTKISNALNANDSLLLTNARIMGCLRNFAGHNLDVKDHVFFKTSDEVFARMLSFIIYSKTQGWI